MSFKVYRIRNKETGKFWRRGGGWVAFGAIYTKQHHAELAINRMERNGYGGDESKSEIVEYECTELETVI
jgi:hypothetical protein